MLHHHASYRPASSAAAISASSSRRVGLASFRVGKDDLEVSRREPAHARRQVLGCRWAPTTIVAVVHVVREVLGTIFAAHTATGWDVAAKFLARDLGNGHQRQQPEQG